MKRFIMVAVGAACVVSTWAQDTDVQRLVVTASRGNTTLERMPLNTSVVTSEEIRRSAAQSLDQLLRDVASLNFTGVPSTQSDPTGHSTRMRGMGNAKVLVLLDGVPVHDPFYLTTQWFKVPLSNIERIEVIRGGSSSTWGNMAVAGVINIITRRSQDTGTEVQWQVGSRGSQSFAVNRQVKASEGLAFNFTLDQTVAKGYSLPPAEFAWRYPGRNPVDARDTNLQVTAYFNPSGQTRGYLRVGTHIQDQNISYLYGNNLQESPDASVQVEHRLDDTSRIQWTAWSQNVSFEKFNGAVCVYVSAKCYTQDTLTTSLASDPTAQLLQYYSQYGSQRYSERGASALFAVRWGSWVRDTQWGVDYRGLQARDVESFYSSSVKPTALQVLSSSTLGQGSQAFVGAFSQARMQPLEPLEVTLSARYDTWHNANMVTTWTTAAGATTGGERPDATKSSFNPSVAMRWGLSDDWSLRGAAYRAFRAPGFNNMLRTYGASGPTIANPDLEPETLLGREWGVDYRSRELTLGLTAFDYRISQMIATYTVQSEATAPALVKLICGSGWVTTGTSSSYANCGTSAPKFYTNDQDGASRGLELSARWAPSKALSLDAAWTRTSTYLTRHGAMVTDPVNLQLAGSPRDVGALGITWTAPKSLSLRAQARYVGRFYYDTTSSGGPFETLAHTVFDMTVSHSPTPWLDWRLSVINLTNLAYSESTYTGGASAKPWAQSMSAPRTLNAGITVRF